MNHYVEQNLLRAPGLARMLNCQYLSFAGLSASDLTKFVAPEVLFVGLAIQLSPAGCLDAVAFAANDQVLVISTTSMSKCSKARSTTPVQKTLHNLLCSKRPPLAGFDMASLAMHIKQAFKCHVAGFDIGTAHPNTGAGCASPGSCVNCTIDNCADPFEVNTLWNAHVDKTGISYTNVCLRAWISGRVASHWGLLVSEMPRVDTRRVTNAQFQCLIRMMSEVESMDYAVPGILLNDFTSVAHTKDNKGVTIHNSRYKTRVRKCESERTKVVLIDENGTRFNGRAIGSEGKRSMIQTTKLIPVDRIKKICVIGKEAKNSAENARDKFVLQVLQGACDIDASLFVRLLWFPHKGRGSVSHQRVTAAVTTGTLNQSQANVVEAMTVGDAPFVVVHGPPGTGKTSTISTAVQQLDGSRLCVWIVAHSNVGVKNIAESLCRRSAQFKVIVSKEFYVEWHEHIYKERVVENLIRSDELPSDPQQMSYLLRDIRVMLCTLSMLSNPALEDKGVFRHVPVERLVIDEASQIGVFSYMHLFAKFTKLSKVCFFGDPKQLPPYGKDVAPGLQCIFDFKHIVRQAYFLDTQYRMPSPIGSFISSAMYDGKLKSKHAITDSSCLAFIDASSGCEVQDGKSWRNDREVQSVVHLVRYYYANKDFCIITPYDAQRNAIQKALEAASLPDHSVYNVDSFQGNEAEFVIVSVVRTCKPGFLKSRNRLNVMLTRCKRGMVIVSKRSFYQSKGSKVRKTLLAELVRHWEALRGPSAWIDWKDVAEERCSLPGVPGRRSQILELPAKVELRKRQAPKPGNSSGVSKDRGEVLALPAKAKRRKGRVTLSETQVTSPAERLVRPEIVPTHLLNVKQESSGIPRQSRPQSQSSNRNKARHGNSGTKTKKGVGKTSDFA